MNLYLDLFLIALAAGSTLEVLYLTLELLILGLEHVKLCTKRMRQFCDRRSPPIYPCLLQNFVDPLVRGFSIWSTYSFQTSFVLVAELLWCLYFSIAKCAASESYFRRGL